MTGLDNWLQQATRHLSKDSAAQVRTEIREHYESARDAATAGGAAAGDADGLALTALGDAKAANRQYRRVLLTSREAKVLREGDREARFVCSQKLPKWLVLAMPLAALAASAALFFTGHAAIAPDVLIGGIGMSPLFAALLLPVYTPSRSRVYRYAKWALWALMVGAFLFAIGPDALKWSWLLLACLWPLAWTEWTRAAIRRKLPAEKWPKHLYL